MKLYYPVEYGNAECISKQNMQEVRGIEKRICKLVIRHYLTPNQTADIQQVKPVYLNYCYKI